MKKYFLLNLLFFAIVVQALCQIHERADPAGFGQDLKTAVPFINLLPRVQEGLKPSKQESLPLYAGYKIPIAENENGKWNDLKTGWKIWRVGLSVVNAKGLNVYFKDLQLKEGDRLFIYNESHTELLGAFTKANNGKFLATEFIDGDRIIVEFNSRNNSDRLPFKFSAVGVSVLNVKKSERGFGDSQSCEVLVNCPEGIKWKSERNGVARILVSEGQALYWCSGALVNNTKLDGKPYFLTAHHCGNNADEDDYLQWVFDFNFEATDCTFPVYEPPSQSVSGSKLIAESSGSTNSGSDFKLLLLADEVPSSYAPFYNGWDRTENNASSGVGIHHPEGDLKMISTFTEPLVSTHYNKPTFDADGKYWMVTWSETFSGHGVTEGGSSGSPIFNQDGFIVGALSGGRASCMEKTLPDYYGKFSYSWESNGADSAQQLKPWLDPGNSGIDRLKGINLDSNNIIANFTADPTEIKVGGQVSFYNQSQGEIIAYEWFFEGGDPGQSELRTPPKVSYSIVGEYDVMLVVKALKESDTLRLKDYIHVLPTLTPNPSSGHFNVHFGNEMPEELDIKVTDLRGRNVNFLISKGNGNSVSIDLSQQPSGIYLITVLADGNREVLKASLVTNSPSK